MKRFPYLSRYPIRYLLSHSLQLLALAAVALLSLSAITGERAEALSLINPGAVAAKKAAANDAVIEVRGGQVADTVEDMAGSVVAGTAVARRFTAVRSMPVQRLSVAAGVADVGSRTGITSGASSSQASGTTIRIMTTIPTITNIPAITRLPAAASS